MTCRACLPLMPLTRNCAYFVPYSACAPSATACTNMSIPMRSILMLRTVYQMLVRVWRSDSVIAIAIAATAIIATGLIFVAITTNQTP